MINIYEYLLGKNNKKLDVDVQEIKDFFNSILGKTSSDVLNETIDNFDKKHHDFFIELIEFTKECVENGFEYSKWAGFGKRHYTETTKTIELSVFRNDVLSLMFIDMAENKCVNCTFKRSNVQVSVAVPDGDLYGYFDDDELESLDSKTVFDSRKDNKDDFYNILKDNI